MKKAFVLTVLAIVSTAILGSLSTAYAQYGMGGMGGYGGYGGYGGFGWGWGGAAGGVGEIYSGMGNLVRSEGQRNVLNAEAEKRYQQAWQENEKARTLHLENQKQIHAEQQRRKREAKAQDASDREEFMASRERQKEFLDAHRPQPLASTQFNAATGSVDWPPALRTEQFNDLRKSFEELTQTQLKYGKTTDTTRSISKVVSDLKSLLRSQILSIPGSDYSEARKFLDRLSASVI